LLSIFVSKGADIHAKNEAALRFTAYNGQLDVVKYLVEKGAGYSCWQ